MPFNKNGSQLSFQSKFTNQYMTPMITGFKISGNDLSNIYAPWDNLLENKASLTNYKLNGIDINTTFNKVSPNLYLQTFNCDYAPNSTLPLFVNYPQPNVYSSYVSLPVNTGSIGKYVFSGLNVGTSRHGASFADYTVNISGIANIIPVVTGAVSWTIPGIYTWVVPNGVTSISCVLIGGGGGGYGNGVPGGDGGSTIIQTGPISGVTVFGGGGCNNTNTGQRAGASSSGIPITFTFGNSSNENSISTNYGAGGAGGASYDPNNGGSLFAGCYTGTLSQNNVTGGGGAGGGGSHAGGGGGGTSLFGAPLNDSGGLGGISGVSGTGGTAVNVASVALNIASNGYTATGGQGQKGAGAGGNFGAGGGSWTYSGGGSGALAYFNNYKVTPGQIITITVGAGGTSDGYGGAGGSGGVRIVYPGTTRQYPYHAQDVYPGSALVTSNVCNENVYSPLLSTYNVLPSLTSLGYPSYSVTPTSINVSYSVPVFYNFVFINKQSNDQNPFLNYQAYKSTSWSFNLEIIKNIVPGEYFVIVYASNEASISPCSPVFSVTV